LVHLTIRNCNATFDTRNTRPKFSIWILVVSRLLIGSSGSPNPELESLLHVARFSTVGLMSRSGIHVTKECIICAPTCTDNFDPSFVPHVKDQGLSPTSFKHEKPATHLSTNRCCRVLSKAAQPPRTRQELVVSHKHIHQPYVPDPAKPPNISSFV
jgi:hypothetical protein